MAVPPDTMGHAQLHHWTVLTIPELASPCTRQEGRKGGAGWERGWEWGEGESKWAQCWLHGQQLVTRSQGNRGGVVISSGHLPANQEGHMKQVCCGDLKGNQAIFCCITQHSKKLVACLVTCGSGLVDIFGGPDTWHLFDSLVVYLQMIKM